MLIIIVCNLQLISDAGFQGEITSISTASQQLEVFSRILKTSINNFLERGEENLDSNLQEFIVIQFRLKSRHSLILMDLRRKWSVMESTHSFTLKRCYTCWHRRSKEALISSVWRNSYQITHKNSEFLL